MELMGLRLSSAQCTLPFFEMKFAIDVTNPQTKAPFLCKYPVYAINWTILFTCEWFWFGIREFYLIKWLMCFTDMQLTGFICISLC